MRTRLLTRLSLVALLLGSFAVTPAQAESCPPWLCHFS